MIESPGDRFRRIIRAWRERKQGLQEPAVMYAPAEPSYPLRPSLQPFEKRVKPPSRPSQPTHHSAVESPESTAAPDSRTVNTTPQRRPNDSPQPSPPPVSVAEESAPVAPKVRELRWPNRGEQETVSSTSSEISHIESAPDLDKLKTPADARRFLERLRIKTDQIVRDFASGVINQRQFQAIYSHYQRQRMAVEKALVEMPGSGAWRAIAIEGHTSFLRQQYAAQVLNYSIYETASGARLTQVGSFNVDDGSLAPMLHKFQSSTQELFGAGMQQTELDAGHWLCGVPGRYTTLVVLFSAEPAAVQLKMIEDLHRDFETVNEMSLSTGDLSQLAFTFTHLWSFEQGPLQS